MSLLGVLNNSTAAALTSDQDATLQAIHSGVKLFNTGEDATVCSGTVTTLAGSDTQQKIFNYFIGKGLTGIAAAGIMGNMSKESGFNPAAEQNAGAWEDLSSLNVNNGGKGGVGLVQWDGGRRPKVINYLLGKGLKDADLHTKSDENLSGQLDYVWQELSTSYSDSTLTPLKAATTVSGATVIFHQNYEISSDDASKIQGRIDDATAILKQYGGSATLASSGGASCSSSGFTASFTEYKQCVYGADAESVAAKKWASGAYGNATICNAGCGPTAMAMIITNLTGQTVTPDMTATYGATNGTTVAGGTKGSAWNIADVIGSHWGLTATPPLGQSVIAINQVLQSGGLVLAAGSGAEPFTTEGHFIVIRGITADGKWLVGNSANMHSDQGYDPQQVITSGGQATPGFNAWGLTK